METVTRCQFDLWAFPHVLYQKNLFLEKNCAIHACAHACKRPGSRVEKLKFFSTCSKRRPNFKILPGNISSVPTFKELDSHREKVTIERSWNRRPIDHMTLTVKSKRRQNGGAACVATVK